MSIRPRLLTVDPVSSVAEKWKSQYFHNGKWAGLIKGSSEDIYQRLVALPSNASPADVAVIIGNDGWVGAECDECEARFTVIIRLGADPDYDYDTLHVCQPCAKKLADDLMALLTP